MTDLDFVTNVKLRKTIEDSIEYIYVLFDKSREEDNDLFKEETNRIIILYVISIIEAILLFIFTQRGDQMNKLEYKFLQNLPSGFNHSQLAGHPIVVGVQKRVKKQDHEIGLFDLVGFFKENNLMSDKTAEKILEFNDIRNTFHFNKARSNQECDLKHVEGALSLLVYLIKNSPRALKK